MAIKDDLISDVTTVLDNTWDIREGNVVPTTDSIALADGAVKLSATILYADLADSTEIAIYNRSVASRVFKSFLVCSSKIIRERGGHIRSFDGDRVMGIFIGDYKNTAAAKAALNINYAFLKIIKPKLEGKYEVFRNGTYNLAHCVGVDTSEVMVVRAGIRNNNDLVWVGRAPNVAAKLSALRVSPYYSYVTEAVYDKLNEEAKTSDGKAMWEQRINSTAIPGGGTIYRSSWLWEP